MRRISEPTFGAGGWTNTFLIKTATTLLASFCCFLDELKLRFAVSNLWLLANAVVRKVWVKGYRVWYGFGYTMKYIGAHSAIERVH